MAQVVSELPYTLESSTHLTRPDVKLFLQPDSNAGETDITQYNYRRSRTHLNIPMSCAPTNYNVTCCDANFSSNQHLKSLGSKKRTEVQLVDPITGFLSAAGESMLRTGVRANMSSFGNSRLEPQNLIPHNADSIRTQPEAIDELKYEIDYRFDMNAFLII